MSQIIALTAPASLPTTPTVAMWLQDKRLCAFLTLAEEAESGHPVSLPADIRAVLPALIDDAQRRVEPATDDQLAIAVTKLLVLVGGPMPIAERVEFQLVVIEELQDVPAEIAIDALKAARRKCTRPGDVLPFVFAHAEDYPARRRRVLNQLINLADRAGVIF